MEVGRSAGRRFRSARRKKPSAAPRRPAPTASFVIVGQRQQVPRAKAGWRPGRHRRGVAKKRRSASWPSALNTEQVQYSSRPPGASSGHSASSSRACVAASAAMSLARRSQRTSGWRRTMPEALHGASSRIASNGRPSHQAAGVAGVGGERRGAAGRGGPACRVDPRQPRRVAVDAPARRGRPARAGARSCRRGRRRRRARGRRARGRRRPAAAARRAARWRPAPTPRPAQSRAAASPAPARTQRDRVRRRARRAAMPVRRQRRAT